MDEVSCHCHSHCETLELTAYTHAAIKLSHQTMTENEHLFNLAYTIFYPKKIQGGLLEQTHSMTG